MEVLLGAMESVTFVTSETAIWNPNSRTASSHLCTYINLKAWGEFPPQDAGHRHSWLSTQYCWGAALPQKVGLEHSGSAQYIVYSKAYMALGSTGASSVAPVC